MAEQTQRWIEAQAIELFRAHGLDGWRIKFDKAKSRAGVCDHRTKLIMLAVGYVATAPQTCIRNTLLHEIAHALVGYHHHHDATWRATALEIGCDGRRCHNVRFTEEAYVFRCGCGKVRLRRHRVVRRMLTKVCVHCRGRLKAYKRVVD